MVTILVVALSVILMAAKMFFMAQGLAEWRDGVEPDVILDADRYDKGIAVFANKELGVNLNQLELDLRTDLGIPPGRINCFLEDLHMKLGIPLSDEDSDIISSVSDIMALANTRADRDMRN